MGITAEEIIGFQNKADLQDPELSRQCQDPDCCPYKADFSLPVEGVLGEAVPTDEQRCTRHLFRQRQFEKDIFHCFLLRAATLEAALVRADLHTKDATTTLQQHFQHKFVNAAWALYIQILLEGGTPEFNLLAKLPPPFPLYGYGSLINMGFPGGGTDHGLGRGLQELPLLLQSTSRKRSPSLELQLVRNTTLTLPSSPVKGQPC